MGRFDPPGSAGRLAASLRSTDWKGRAKQAAQTLKDEYEAGKRGDDAPVQPIWASPKEQLDAVLGLLRSAGARDQPGEPGHEAIAAGTMVAGTMADGTIADGTIADGTMADGTMAADTMAADADQVAEALRGVDWNKVKAATAERSTDAARTVRAMAEQVDWAKVQPVAAQVSTALIAAVASGQLGVGGRLGSTVARAIVDQGGLAQQVAARVNAQQLPVPADLRRVIDATARDA